MKNSMKKCIALLSVFIITLQGSMVNASTKGKDEELDLSTLDKISEYLDSSPTTQTVVMDEIEYLASVQNMDEAQLRSCGYSDDDVKAIKNVDLKKQLLDLGKKGKKELKKKGYTDRQIKEIKAYDGKIDAMAYARSARISNAKVTFKYGLAGKNSTKKVMIAFDVRWSADPDLLSTDNIAVAWYAYDANSRYIDTRPETWCRIGTKYVDDEKGTSVTLYDDFETKNHYVNPKFNMRYRYNKTWHVARVIGGTVEVEPKNSSQNIGWIKIKVGYGHTTSSNTSPKIDVSNVQALNFSYSKGQSVLIDSNMTFKYSDYGIVTANQK